MESSDILFERRGAAGIITLNRPKALNAVTYEMVRALARQLKAWEGDAAVTRVVIKAEGGRAFFGGPVQAGTWDIAEVSPAVDAGVLEDALAFVREVVVDERITVRGPDERAALTKAAELTLGADELVWTNLITGPRNDFMQRAMRGQFQVSGSGYEYLRLTKPLHALIDNARELAAEGVGR